LLKITRILITKTPIAFFIKKSKVLKLPGFEGVPLYDVIKFLFGQLKTHGLTERAAAISYNFRAAAISYNFIMAIPPSLLFLFTLIPNLPFISKSSLRSQIRTIIVDIDIIPSPEYNKGIINFVNSFLGDPRIGLLSFGLILSLFFASNAMMGIIRTFNRKYIGFENINVYWF